MTAGPAPEPAASKQPDARARLLAAAVESFASKGFHGTTTRDIATAAGMSPAALYVHHRSKEELLFLISKAGHEATLQLVTEAAASSTVPVEQLRAVVRAFAEHHAENHTHARIVNYELAALRPEHRKVIARLRRKIEAQVRSIIDTGVESGSFELADPGMITLAVLSLGIDIARWFRDEGRWSPAEVGEHYAQLALRLVGAKPATRSARRAKG